MIRRPLLLLAALATLASTAAVVGSAATLQVRSASIDTFDSAIPASTTTPTPPGGDTTPPTFEKAEFFDTNTNGRLDRIVVTYSEPLGQAGTPADWTIANRASGMGSGTPTVTIAGSAVQLDVTEATSGFATGPTNLQLSVAAAIVKDSAGNGAAALSGRVVADKAGPVPVSLTIANGGGESGQPERDDTVAVEFSEPLDRQTICGNTADPDWINVTSGVLDDSNAIVVTFTEAASDTLTAAAAAGQCAQGLRFGSVAFDNDGYISSTRTFAGASPNQSEVRWTPASRTLTLVLGTPSGATIDVNASSVTAEYTPDAGLRDVAGNGAVGSVSKKDRHF